MALYANLCVALCCLYHPTWGAAASPSKSQAAPGVDAKACQASLEKQEHEAEWSHNISQYKVKFLIRDCLHQAHHTSQVGQSFEVRHESLSKELASNQLFLILLVSLLILPCCFVALCRFVLLYVALYYLMQTLCLLLFSYLFASFLICSAPLSSFLLSFHRFMPLDTDPHDSFFPFKKR